MRINRKDYRSVLNYGLRILSTVFLLTFAASAEEGWLAIEGGTVFDGTGAVHRNAVVLVRGDRIEAVGPVGKVRIPNGTERIDARGKFVLPGFVDLHFHYSPQRGGYLPFYFLARGVTTLRDMGNWIADIKAWEKEYLAKGLTLPRLPYSGPHIDGTHPAYPNDALVSLDEMDARRAVNWLVDNGATSIKIYFRLPLSYMKAAIEEADKRGVPAHGHLEVVDPRDAMEVGLDGFEHVTSVGRALLSPKESQKFRQGILADNNYRREGRYKVWAKVDPEGERATELIRLMLKHGAVLDATIAIFEPLKGEKGNEEKWKAVRNMAAFTVRYQKEGGPVSIGSHGSVDNAEAGWAYHRELEAHVEAGMSPSDALQAATRVGAEALRFPDRGVLAPGKLADITILDADPLENISNTRKVNTVILGGKVLDREELLATRKKK